MRPIAQAARRLAVVLLLPVLLVQPGSMALARGGETDGAGQDFKPCSRPLSTHPLPSPPLVALGSQSGLPGYADRLSTTPYGWPRLAHWCVWIEPVLPSAASTAVDLEPRQQRWRQAVESALQSWRSLVPFTLVADPDAAQVHLWRRVPPLGRDGAGRPRASHGRALLRLAAVERRPGQWRLEPAIEVLIGPGQRQEALQASALHELGHAFGIWGHSDSPGDAMAAAPGPVPVLMLSDRDRSTVRWLYAQPTAYGGPVLPPPAAGPPAHP